MNKIKILGISKSSNHNVYTFRKNQEFIPAIMKFLLDLGCKDDNVPRFFYVSDKKYGEPISGKYRKISEFEDQHYFFKLKDFGIDLVFAKNKVFLIINTKSDKQEFISNKIFSIFNKNK